MPRPADTSALRGLPNPNTTPLPNCIVDEYLPFFTGAELKVILYLVRRTLGFHKTRDAISLGQICNGIVRKDGRRLDRGTGLHKSTACDALNALTSWGMIRRVTRRDPVRGDLPTEYILWIEGEVEGPGGPKDGKTVPPSTAASPSTTAVPGRREHDRALPDTATAPVSVLTDTPREDNDTRGGSARTDTPLSAFPDSPVSDQADRQKPALQKKQGQDRSTIREVPTRFAETGQRRVPPLVAAPAGDRPQVGPSDAGSSPVTVSRQGAEGCERAAGQEEEGPTYDPTRDELHRFAEVIAREFNDQAPFSATLSRLVNLYRRARLPVEAFADRLDAARQRTKERTAAIRPPPARSKGESPTAKNKMPYFFALFEESLGLRETPPVPTPGPVRRELAAQDPPQSAAQVTPADPPHPQRVGPSDLPPRPRPSPARAVEGPPPAMAEDDARVIGVVVREFSRQFAEYAAAVALGDWAVALWRRSGLPRQRFLEVAGVASEGLVRDRAVAVSAPLFRARLAAALGLPTGDGVSACDGAGESEHLLGGDIAERGTNVEDPPASQG